MLGDWFDREFDGQHFDNEAPDFGFSSGFEDDSNTDIDCVSDHSDDPNADAVSDDDELGCPVG